MPGPGQAQSRPRLQTLPKPPGLLLPCHAVAPYGGRWDGRPTPQSGAELRCPSEGRRISIIFSKTCSKIGATAGGGTNTQGRVNVISAPRTPGFPRQMQVNAGPRLDGNLTRPRHAAATNSRAGLCPCNGHVWRFCWRHSSKPQSFKVTPR